MNSNNTNETISREEALRKVAEVLEEALAEYEALEKMDLEMAEDPSRPVIQDEAQSEDSSEPSEEEVAEDHDETEAKDEDEDEDEDKQDEKDEEISDEALKSEYAAVVSEMKRRGLIQNVAKSESQESDLKKAMETEISELKKTISTLTDTVSKIASQPATRKGVSGLAPLRKSEEGEERQLRKSEVVEKLLELKKSGDRRVNTALINRVETSRMNPEDLSFIKGILG